jgi:aldehyde dehydrogenase (NAD+)
MQEKLQFYIDGRWVDPVEARRFELINPATEEPIARIALGSEKDVDLAVNAARRALRSFSETTREERIALLESIVNAYQKRYDELAETISLEMGAPLWLSKAAQAATGLGHLMQALDVLRGFQFEEVRGTTLIRHEPIGVCGLLLTFVVTAAGSLIALVGSVISVFVGLKLDHSIDAEIRSELSAPESCLGPRGRPNRD